MTHSPRKFPLSQILFARVVVYVTAKLGADMVQHVLRRAEEKTALGHVNVDGLPLNVVVAVEELLPKSNPVATGVSDESWIEDEVPPVYGFRLSLSSNRDCRKEQKRVLSNRRIHLHDTIRRARRSMRVCGAD
jgi:hypothetical protein